MVRFVQIQDLPHRPAGEEENGVRVRAVITEETTGAKRVQAEQYEVGGGSSSPDFGSRGSRQFFYVSGGGGEVQLGGVRRTVRVGHGVYAEPGEVCRFRNTGGGVLEFYRFVIPIEGV